MDFLSPPAGTMVLNGVPGFSGNERHASDSPCNRLFDSNAGAGCWFGWHRERGSADVFDAATAGVTWEALSAGAAGCGDARCPDERLCVWVFWRRAAEPRIAAFRELPELHAVELVVAVAARRRCRG